MPLDSQPRGDPGAGAGELQEVAAGDPRLSWRAPQPLLGAVLLVGPFGFETVSPSEIAVS